MAGGSQEISPATVRVGADLLYRWWLQSSLRIIPEAYVRCGNEATVVCPGFALVASEGPAGASELRDLTGDLRRPIYPLALGRTPGYAGFDLRSQSVYGSAPDLLPVLELLAGNQALLRRVRPLAEHGMESLKTVESGSFAVWAGGPVRLLLQPFEGERYGFSVTRGGDGGLFFFRSRSCREGGRVAMSGIYKRARHVLTTGARVGNLDLTLDDGSPILLRAVPAGAGFKVFERKVVPDHTDRLIALI